MRSTSTRTSLLAVMAAALTLAPAAGALAATGGVQSAPAVTSAPRISHRASLATWFGPGFYGQRTACGQVLTPAVVGVAHRSLPCGTLVKMSYHGRGLIVPVIDRGPYAHNGAAWERMRSLATRARSGRPRAAGPTAARGHGAPEGAAAVPQDRARGPCCRRALARTRRAELPPFGARPARPSFARARRDPRRRSRL